MHGIACHSGDASGWHWMAGCKAAQEMGGKGEVDSESGSREEVELSSRLPLPPFLSRLPIRFDAIKTLASR
jgi:hypothetical protein